MDAVDYQAGMLRGRDRQEVSLAEVARASYQTPGDDVAPGLAAQGDAFVRPLHLSQRLPYRRSRDRPRDRRSPVDRYVIFDDYAACST